MHRSVLKTAAGWRRMCCGARAEGVAYARPAGAQRRHASAAPSPSAASTIDDAEVRKFTALADQWWRDVDGPFAGLHQLNAVRVPLIRRALRHSSTTSPTDETSLDVASLPLAGVRVLDIGCGGGILSEALGRLGASVTGIDASGANVAAATAHARLDPSVSARVRYVHTSAEALAASGALFDGVVMSEVLEHVADVETFLSAAAAMVRPGGPLVVTTINRTVSAFALAILGAEYVARIVPAGTHEWAKFVTPDELKAVVLRLGLTVESVQGMWFNPLSHTWGMSGSTDVNYALVARRGGA